MTARTITFGIQNDVKDAVGEFFEQNPARVPVKNLIGKGTSFNAVDSLIQRAEEPVFQRPIDLPVPRPYSAHVGKSFSAKPNCEIAH